MRIGVTGSSGFVGRFVLEQAQNLDATVVKIHIPRTRNSHSPDSLADFLSQFQIDALLNLAAVRNPQTRSEWYVNAQLPQDLFSALSRISSDAQFTHISSFNILLSDRDRTRYCRSKSEADKALAGSAANVYRPGLVWAWSGGGDAERIQRYLKLPLPFHPFAFPGAKFRPLAARQFATFVLERMLQRSRSDCINVLGDRPMTLWQLAKDLANTANKRLVPVPCNLLSWALPSPISAIWPAHLLAGDSTTARPKTGQVIGETVYLPFLDAQHQDSARNVGT